MARIPTNAWKVWLAIVSLGFLILESLALISKESGDTLSENTRKWLQVHDLHIPTKRGRAALGGSVVGAVIGLLLWFVPHIASSSWGVLELIPALLIGGLIGGASLSAIVPNYVPPVSEDKVD